MKWTRPIDRPELLLVRIAPWDNLFVTGWCIFALAIFARFGWQLPLREFPGGWPFLIFAAIALILLPWNHWGRRELRLSPEGLEVTASLFGLRRSRTWPLPASVACKEERTRKGGRHWVLQVDGNALHLRMPQADTEALAKALAERLTELRAARGPYR